MYMQKDVSGLPIFDSDFSAQKLDLAVKQLNRNKVKILYLVNKMSSNLLNSYFNVF